MNIRDVSHFSKSEEEGKIGSRGKLFLICQDDNTPYYFKYPKNDTYLQYEIWHEAAASEYGRWMEFNVVSYEIAMYENNLGVLCPSFTKCPSCPYNELIHGYQLLKENIDDFMHIKERPVHDVSQVYKLFTNKLNIPIDSFAEMLIFDALIGNTDRHTENWGVLFDRSNNSKPYVFAPIYDLGSTLGHELDEGWIVELCKSRDGLDRYIENGKQEIRYSGDSRKLNHFSFLEKLGQDINWAEILNSCLDRVFGRSFPEKEWDDLIERWLKMMVDIGVSKSVLSLQRGRMMKMMAKKRWQRLLQLHEKH